MILPMAAAEATPEPETAPKKPQAAIAVAIADHWEFTTAYSPALSIAVYCRDYHTGKAMNTGIASTLKPLRR
ncbi:MAG: hypothetical protein ACLVES_06540 [Faecalibacterium prausnitzii]